MEFGALELPVAAVDVFLVFPDGSPSVAHQVIRVPASHARRGRDVVIDTPKTLRSKFNIKVHDQLEI